MDAMSKTPHTSVSQIEMYAKCPRQYEYRYMRGMIRPPGFALLVGSGVHTGCEVAMKSKALTGNNLRTADVVDAAVNGYDERTADGGVCDDPGDGTVDSNRDRVAAFASYWAAAVQPDYVPAGPEAVECRFNISITPALDFVGVIDLMTHAGRLVDWKTGTKALTETDADTSLQLTAYSAAYRRINGADPLSVAFEQVVERKNETARVHQIGRRRTTEDYQGLLQRIDLVAKAKQAGIFPPCSPSSWHCQPRWCGYARQCRYCAQK